MTRHLTMGRYQFMFYATASDLAPVLSFLEAQKKLQYTPTRHVVTDRAQIYLSCADIPDFGRTSDPTAVMNPDYLVALQGTPVQVNHLNRSDLWNGAWIIASGQHPEWLEKRRKDAPFVVELSANNGFQLALGVGTGVGFAQFRPFEGSRPYFMALPARRRVKRGSICFHKDMALTTIPGRYILNFDELKQVALDFLSTGKRSDVIRWAPV